MDYLSALKVPKRACIEAMQALGVAAMENDGERMEQAIVIAQQLLLNARHALSLTDQNCSTNDMLLTDDKFIVQTQTDGGLRLTANDSSMIVGLDSKLVQRIQDA